MPFVAQCAEVVVTIGGVVGLVGGFYRFVLLPNLREQLFEPVAETHRQVTQNGGHNDPPTLPDRFHDLQVSVDALATRDEQLADAQVAAALAHKQVAEGQALMQASVSAVVLVLDEHLRWSRAYVEAQERGKPTPPIDTED